MRASLLAAGAALAASGCLSYSPEKFSHMSSYDLCDLRHFQPVNLTAAGRAGVEAELQRRGENCRGLLAQIQKDHDDDDYDRVYNRQSP